MITVILPVRNGGEYLKTCVRSVLAQTFTDFNLIVLENCSNDGSTQWLAGIADSRVAVHPAASSLSMTENWNRALSVRKQEYFTFIQHDDFMAPTYLERIQELTVRYPGVGLIQVPNYRIDAAGRPLGVDALAPTVETGIEFLAGYLKNSRPGFPGSAFRSHLFDQMGGFRDWPKGLFADLALTIDLAIGSACVGCCSEPLYFYRRHDRSYSLAAPAADFVESFRPFCVYLSDVRSRVSALETILSECICEFVLESACAVYAIALRQATMQNQTVDVTLCKGIQDALAVVDPQLVDRLADNRTVRRWEARNRDAQSRLACTAYYRLRALIKDLRQRTRPNLLDDMTDPEFAVKRGSGD